MNLKEKLAEEIDTCDWSLLDPHFKRGAVFIVDESLNLAEVGVNVANDEVEIIKDYLSNEQLRKPSDEEVKNWEEKPHEKMAQFLIVQPYVLIKKIDNLQ
jgi:hypothetical protein